MHGRSTPKLLFSCPRGQGRFFSRLGKANGASLAAFIHVIWFLGLVFRIDISVLWRRVPLDLLTDDMS